jgi:diguanylate cyclase (GGDEF)-like protein
VTGALELPPLTRFSEACALVVAYLGKTIPLAFWSVSRFDGERQIYVCVQDGAYGKTAGGSHAWSDSFCRHMITGSAPQIAPDAMAVPQYSAAGVAQVLSIGAYVGVPICDGDGSLFGTLCGMDPAIQSGELLDQAPLLHMLAALLGQTLHADRLRAEALDREAELQRSDQLTGLPNRAMFLHCMARALDRHRRDLRPLAVLLFDLDDFKAVNDTFGHASGDRLLVRVADRLRGALRPADTLARLSGDEFALLVEDGADPVAMAGRVVGAFQEPFTVEGTPITISASVGVAELGPGAEVADVDMLLAHADAAMCSAKHLGKGRLAVYDPIMSRTRTRELQLRDLLRQAIADGVIEAVYQPIVELASGRVIAFEALARWRHDGQVVDPSVFVPIAARSGLLPDLTDHMMWLAAAQLDRWSTALGHRQLQIGVNVPPTLISHVDFPARVAACIRHYQLAPGQLVLEITEDALLVDPNAAREVTSQLRKIGAILALDDFGSGYSSLLHLQQISPRSVKIDRCFARDLDTNPATERFMAALLALCRDLGLRVIVEGVERAAQADVLRRLGCSHAQGYLFGRPARPEEIDELAYFAGSPS